MIDPHLYDCRPVFAALPCLPTIGVQVGRVAAVRVAVIAVLRVLESGEAELP